MTDLEARKERLDGSIAGASQQLGLIDLEREEADSLYQKALGRYTERAIEAYKNGPTSDLLLILSAGTVSDMYSVAQALGHVAEKDTQSLDRLVAARTSAEQAQAQVDDRKQELIRSRAEAEALSEDINGALAERRSVMADLGSQIKALQEKAREAAAAAAAAATDGYQGGAGTTSEDLLALLEPAGPSDGIPDGFTRTGITFEGTASWYGPGFEGQATASGDIFDSRLFTAASKELPLHSWLYVEHEGRGIVVLINDRGPYVGDRILDLSHAAAQAIGISGLGWIKAEVLLKIG